MRKICKFCILLYLIGIFCVNISYAKETTDLKQKLEYINFEYWKSFDDEILTNYILCSIKNSPTAKKASWKVEESRQMVKISFAKEVPTFDVKTNYIGLHIPRLDNFNLEQNGFLLPFSTQWELDLLLKNRDKTRSKKALYKSTIAEEKGIYISLASQVGTAYFNLIKYDKLLEYKTVYISNLQKILELAKLKLDEGIIDTIEYTNLQNEYEKELSIYYELKINQELTQNLLATLVGDSSDNANQYKRKRIDYYYNFQIPDLIINSNIIYSRPDVIRAENRLLASKIDVRVARKELFPSFNINGNLIFNTLSRGTFFSWESALAYLMAGATQEIFSGGKRIATLKVQKAIYEQMFEEYQETNLNAIKEINNSLCYLQNDNKIINSCIKRILNKKSNLTKSTQKYQFGVISLYELLLEKNSLTNTQETLINAKAKNLIDYISLYKATGGKF